MYIKYTNTEEDLIKFQLYHNDNSPSVKRTLLFSRIGITLAIIIIFGIIGYEKNKIVFFNAGLIGGLVHFFYFPYSMRQLSVKLAKKMCKEGENKSILCEHILEIGENSFIEKTDYGEASCLFSCAERICLTEEYAYIYFSALAAHIVPIKRISEGNFEEFIKELQLKCNL